MGNHTVAESKIPSLPSVMQAWITRAKNKADARARQAARGVPPPRRQRRRRGRRRRLRCRGRCCRRGRRLGDGKGGSKRSEGNRAGEGWVWWRAWRRRRARVWRPWA
mmetsp:Transcript_6608/g.10439  ORF Transcript_6608/g.10439 Transcript_6608/m.10439 type:complete len:107 (-) Transcript_6608:131-451(-)